MSKARYRKPSVSTLLGITKWKKRVKKALGINKLLWPFRAVPNYKRRMLRRAGYYSPQMKMMRAMKRGQAPGPIGPLQISERGGEHAGSEHGAEGNALLMAAMLAKGMGGEEQKGHKQHEADGPNLAQAMLLASALKGAEGKHAPKDEAESSHERHPPKEGHAHPHAAHASTTDETPDESPGKCAKSAPKPKRHRGVRLLGLLLMSLLTAAGIVAAWYFWVL